MNLQETAQTLAYFAAAWPNFGLTEETVEVWLEAVADINPEHAVQARETLVKTSEWVPSIARFRQECASIAHWKRERFAAAAGLPPGPAAALPIELVADLRQNLASNGPRKHWHGGPHPCPSCGGVIPAVATDRSARRGS